MRRLAEPLRICGRERLRPASVWLGLRRNAIAAPRLWLAAVLAGALLSGCSTGPVVRTTVLSPALSDAAAARRQVAVLPFEQRRFDPDVASEIEAALVNQQVDGQPYFRVIERRRLQLALDELNLQRWGLVSDDRAAAAGRLLGAQAILTGQVVRHDVASHRYAEQRRVCVRQEQKTDSQGRTTPGRCLAYGPGEVICERQTATVSLRPRLIDVESGVVVFSQELSGSSVATRCHGDWAVPPSEADLIATARRQVVEQLRAALAPTVRTVSLPLLTTWRAAAPAAAKERHERALEFARAGRMERACELWQQALADAPGEPTVLHNLGVCAEVAGDLAGAARRYAQAERASDRPDAVIVRAIGRVEAAVVDRQRLQRQGLRP